MEKTRQVKILSIVTLVIAIAGMTLGFAAFSTTLSISSSATVTPSSEDFKINIYGFKDLESMDLFLEDMTFDDSYLSSTSGVAAEWSNVSPSPVTINNTNHTISGVDINFNQGIGDVSYVFIIKNEGKYDAYLDLSNMIVTDDGYVLGNMPDKNCVAKDGATESLVEDACEGVKSLVTLIDKNSGDGLTIDDDYYMIPTGGYEILGVGMYYEGPFADGPFDVEFEDFQFKFSTVK